MGRRRQFLYTVVVVFALSQDASAAPIGQMKRAYTVDDMLKIEGIGEVRFSPDETTIIFVYQPPYEERGQYGIDHGGQILQLPLSGAQDVEPLFEHDSNAKYWLGDTSPDGTKLLIFRATRHQVDIGVYEFEDNRFTLIEEAVQFQERFEGNNPVWINNDEFVFSARSQESMHSDVRARQETADRISALREKAFKGEVSVASMSTNPHNRWYSSSLLRYNVRTKRVSVLGAGRFGSLTLSADGKRLAALRLGQRLMHFPVDRLTDWYHFDTRLYIFDLENASSKSFVPDSHVKMGSLRWSSSGTQLSYFAWHHLTTMDKGGHHVTNIDTESTLSISIDGLEESWRGVYGSSTIREPIAAEWLQNQLIVHGILNTDPQLHEIEQTASTSVAANNKAKWYEVDLETMIVVRATAIDAQTHQVHRFRDGRLLLHSDKAKFVASESAAPKALNLENPNSVEILNGGWSDEIEDTLVFTTRSERTHAFGFLDLTRNEVMAPMTGIASRVLAWAPGTQQVIVRADTEEGGSLYLQTAAKAPIPLFTFNQHLSKVEHPRWQTIEYQGADGIETYSCVLLPYNYDASKPYPTVVDIYPGVGKGCRGQSGILDQPLGRSFWGISNEVLSANGYIVVTPSNSYGRNQVDGMPYGGLATQVDEVLDALVLAGMTDPERIGIWGFSNGSMAALWLASMSNRFKAVIPMFGASSPHIEYFGGTSLPGFQLYLGNPIKHQAVFESERGGTPTSMGRSAFTDPVVYINASPLDRAKHFCSPVMMIHSDLDGFTPYHYEAFFTAMYRLGKRAELVRYYGEGHGLSSPGNIRDVHDRVLRFLDKHVTNAVPSPPCSTVTLN